jgi:hypothetical protein
MFVYAIRSPYTKESYFRLLRRFFDDINFCEGKTMDKRCNTFAYRGRNDSNWAFSNILKFLHSQKERVEKNEITASTLRNYVKTIKMFCEVTDIIIQWKKVTRGIPRGKRYADDRAPSIEEICKIIEYPDRRIKPIVYTMASSGIRIGAWDSLQWKHVTPITNDNGEVIAAKLLIYAGDSEEYYCFITTEAYTALKEWMNYRSNHGENITSPSLTTTPPTKKDVENHNNFIIGIFGASTGAAAALVAAALVAASQRPDIVAAIVSRSGRPNLADLQSQQKVKAPTLS